MPNILVLGDLITDKYRMCTATRLCPEGPVPVLTNETTRESLGGAGLVVEQLGALSSPGDRIHGVYGSQSTKERIFADDRLMLRVDKDTEYLAHRDVYAEDIKKELGLYKYDAIVVSDYGKGGIPETIGRNLVQVANTLEIPLFVDAKNHWDWYWGCFAMFPNKSEQNYHNLKGTMAKHIINKLGPEGCKVDDVHIPTKNHPVRDTTGAGDVFLAAFVQKYLTSRWDELNPAGTDVETQYLRNSAEFANRVAGISVEYVGTHVVTREELENN